MTAADAATTTVPEGPWYGRPRLMVPLLGGLAVLAALLTPEKANREMGDRRLTTRETTPASGSLLAEVPRALGWRADENTTATVPPRPDMVHLVLTPSEPLRAPEVHALLERVRAGAGLFVIINEERDLLADSLHLGAGDAGSVAPQKAAGVTCRASSAERLPWLANAARYRAVRWEAPPPGATDTLLRFAAPDTTRSAVLLGFAYGRGRIVAGADADLFRNDELRRCELGYAPLYVSLLEYLRDSSATVPRRWLMFDEYHQGLGPQPGTVRAVVTFFSETSAGHVLAQLAVAALLYLLMRAPRIVPPAHDTPDERRSPIEHVDALARAYVQVGASKTATQRLVRGLRRRLERGTVRGVMSLPDEAFLDRVATRTPALGASVDVVRQALARTTPPREFTAVGDALAHIEQTLRQESR